MELNCWLRELWNKHFLLHSERNVYFFYISNTDLRVVTRFEGQSFLCCLNYFNTNWDTQQLAGASPSPPSPQRPAAQNASCCSSSSCPNLRFSAASVQETVTLCQKTGCAVQGKRHLPLLCYFCYQRSGQVTAVHRGRVKRGFFSQLNPPQPVVKQCTGTTRHGFMCWEQKTVESLLVPVATGCP